MISCMDVWASFPEERKKERRVLNNSHSTSKTDEIRQSWLMNAISKTQPDRSEREAFLGID